MAVSRQGVRCADPGHVGCGRCQGARCGVKPIALVERQTKLHVQSLRMLRAVKLNGGYQLGDEVGLLIEARNGIGCIERGPILFSPDGAYRSKAGDNLVSDPATP